MNADQSTNPFHLSHPPIQRSNHPTHLQECSFSAPTAQPADEIALVQIDWGASTDDQIADSFRAWVKANRPATVRPVPARGHKLKDWRANLTRLAAMRLLTRFSARDLVTAWPQSTPSCINAARLPPLLIGHALSAFRGLRRTQVRAPMPVLASTDPHCIVALRNSSTLFQSAILLAS